MSTAAPDQTVAQGAPGAPPAPAQVNGQPQGVAVPFPPDYNIGGLSNIEPTQLLKILRAIPGVFPTMESTPAQKADAARALQDLAGPPFPPNGQGLPVGYTPAPPGGMNEPGPSSHPRGPPGLGQLSAVAMQAAPVAGQGDVMKPGSPVQEMGAPPQQQQVQQPQGSTPPSTGGRRGRNPAIGSDEWTRQRKDNHKEVERRRRGNINDGINELGRIVPNGTGEKAKGAILARAVQYIHHLKENEARNIEKWTLEKLLMDQAMGDLQAQLEEVKRLWDEERQTRQRLERELEALRGNAQGQGEEGGAVKRGTEDEDDRDGKRVRTE